jgi:hypothetical protein
MSTLIWFILGVCAAVSAQTPRFSAGRCHGSTCYVSVGNPGSSQVFYEKITEGKVIVYQIMDALEDNPFFVRVFVPSTQSKKMCDGGIVTVRINNQVVQYWNISMENYGSFMDPFLQISGDYIGKEYENNSPLDLKDELEVRLSGPSHNIHCHVAVEIGKTQRLYISTLLGYPVVSLRAWSWGWRSVTFNGIVYPLLAVSFLICLLLYLCKGKNELAGFVIHIALSFYLAVFLTRALFMIMASSEAKDINPSSHAWGFFICFLDFLFFLAVGVFVLDRWFHKLSETLMCCSILCCPCKLFFSCLEDGGTRAASIFVFVLSGFSLFAFSSGFYAGPTLLLLGSVIALAQRQSSENFTIY